MAASSAVAAGNFMVGKVAILLELDEKLKAMAGTKRKMEEFKELSTIIDMVIQDVESHPSINNIVNDLLKKLKYLAYDLEDVVEYYDTKVLQKKQRSKTFLRLVRDFFSSNNQVVFKCRLGGMIKAVTDSLNSILQQRSILLNLQQGMSEPSAQRETHSRNRFDVIGRKPEKKMLVDMLTKDDDDDDESNHDTVKVIAIVGMGGLGKTTLAQLVYNDDAVKAHFGSSRMWTVVGAEFDAANIMNSVLQQDTGNSGKISDIQLLRKKIEKELSGKKFLFVMDDVWNEDRLPWENLKSALICGARGSKILVTTRSQQVSSIMDSSYIHQMEELSPGDCLSLFQQFAFGDQPVDQNLMEIGEKIVEKCGGVPLAAISLGSMLRSNREETYWSSVLKNEIWQSENEDKVLAVLKLSYATLRPQSKKCFAFASIFSKNKLMGKDDLIQLWIANGFVLSEPNFDAEANGNSVFDELELRSFFRQPPSHSYYSPVTKWTMHDLMHDLARSVSADAYWNSYQDSVEAIRKRTYHLQIDKRKVPDMTEVLGKKPLYLRTFMFKNKRPGLNINWLEVFSKLKFLRVLDVSESGIRKIPTSIGNLIHLRYLNLYMNRIEVLPTSIGNLIHLRYLNLYCNEIEVLPDSITHLSNLQYLNLSFNCKLRELPKELGNMQNLRDLDLPMDNTLTDMPSGLSRLTNLRRLPLFIASDKTGACSLTELQGLKLHGEMKIKISKDFQNYSCGGSQILMNKKLNELCIEFNGLEGYGKDVLDDLCPNTSLKKLSISNYRSPQFPTWLKELQLPNLVEVCLMNCRVCEQILPFQNLQFLQKLDLQSMAEITHMAAEFHEYGGFPSLQKLYLDKMDNLEEWSKSHDVDELFPKLQSLEISGCPKLKSMPRLPTIKYLEISRCSGSLLSCIERLTSLSVFKVDNMDDVTSFPSGCFRNLTSLTDLEITNCREFQSLLGDELQHLEMIRSLVIEECWNFVSFPFEGRHLSSLCFLQLKGCPSIILKPKEVVEIMNSVPRFVIQICHKKVNLRGQLQCLPGLEELFFDGAHNETSRYKWHGLRQLIICCCDELESLMTAEQASIMVLEELYINGISDLTTLPDWLQHLKSLHLLSVKNCPRLGMLPRDLKKLLKLNDLKISGCPLLESIEYWSIFSADPNV